MTKSVTINFQLVKADTQSFVANKSPLIANVSGSDWMSFLDALGWAENSGKYGGFGGFNNAYVGMYQVGNDYLKTDLKFYSGVKGIYTGIGGELLGIADRTDFSKNPIAEDMAAIMEFAGIPKNGASYLSRYSSVSSQFISKGFTSADFNQMVGKEFIINYTDVNGNVVMTDDVTFTEAGISAAAHLIGQGATGNAMADIWKQYLQNGGASTEPFTATLQLTPIPHTDKNGQTFYTYKYCDGGNITFSTYVKLLQNFNIDPLLRACHKFCV